MNQMLQDMGSLSRVIITGEGLLCLRVSNIYLLNYF